MRQMCTKCKKVLFLNDFSTPDLCTKCYEESNEKPEPIPKTISEWPATCNLCGHSAYVGLQFYDCSNKFCRNFKTPLRG